MDWLFYQKKNHTFHDFSWQDSRLLVVCLQSWWNHHCGWNQLPCSSLSLEWGVNCDMSRYRHPSLQFTLDGTSSLTMIHQHLSAAAFRTIVFSSFCIYWSHLCKFLPHFGVQFMSILNLMSLNWGAHWHTEKWPAKQWNQMNWHKFT